MLALVMITALCLQDAETTAELKALRKEVAELKAEVAKMKAQITELKEVLKTKPEQPPVDADMLKKAFLELANKTGGNDAALAQAAVQAIATNKEGYGWTIGDHFMKDASEETRAAYKEWRNAVLKVKR